MKALYKWIGRPAGNIESWNDDEKCRGWYTFEELEGVSAKCQDGTTEADLGMFSMFGGTGAPQKWAPTR